MMKAETGSVHLRAEEARHLQEKPAGCHLSLPARPPAGPASLGPPPPRRWV